MPLFDYVCRCCGLTKEVLVRKSTDVVPCPNCVDQVRYQLTSESILSGPFDVTMERQQAAPSFVVKGFNSATGYAGARTFHQNHGNGIRSVVTGNPEGFSEGIL